ncbi:MAG: DUF2460 domain-containing protein [Janthinobacterium lividum]
MNFNDIRMPEFIESFAIGKPEFATSCVTTKSGREARHLDRENVCQKYLIKNAKLSAAEFEQFNSFLKSKAW